MEENAEEIILIPGIGGFPEFHQDLLDQLRSEQNHKITSSPHGDHNSSPYCSLNEHVAYWSELIRNESKKRQRAVHIVGISFGSAIAISLPKDILTGIKTITLVSPPHVPWSLRTLLSISCVLGNSITSKLFGKLLFWWSERKVDNIDRLHEQRERLYDDLSLVYLRLWNRLKALLDMPSLSEFAKNPVPSNACIIYSKDEYAYLHSPVKEKDGSTALKTFKLVVIPGDHSESINNSKPLASAINEFIGNAT